MKKASEGCNSPACLPCLSSSGFCRKLPGSPSLPSLSSPQASSLICWPLVPRLSTVSLICLLIWGIKSPLFRQRNSLVLRKTHSFGIRKAVLDTDSGHRAGRVLQDHLLQACHFTYEETEGPERLQFPCHWASVCP